MVQQLLKAPHDIIYYIYVPYIYVSFPCPTAKNQCSIRTSLVFCFASLIAW
jgi:hypothetical protein